jgi:hypothetical protein
MLYERDENYLSFIRSLPCLVCGRPGCDPHHQPEAGHGATGIKTDDYRALPLCSGIDGHHNGNGTAVQPGSFHGMSWAFYRRYGIDVEEVIAGLVAGYFFGVPVAHVEKWRRFN